MTAAPYARRAFEPEQERVYATGRFNLIPDDRRSGRQRPFSCRFYTGKWEEHRQAADFLAERVDSYGEGVGAIVRALLLYRHYLNAGLGAGETAASPGYASRRFTLLPPEQRSANRRPFSCRFYTGKWEEHRQAADFIDERVNVYGEGVETIVRALLLYRDYLALLGGGAEQPETLLRRLARGKGRS